ncbi:adipose-secreted signaling protein [Phymastichus coffea]|uniref:adipose-secreted signaling protein n=1 Tax=Phymastichus coffea TaxID=108790 RepID=UPI00273BB131|nr:adipose-secreted signaling protein [Phymastichus coffea]
MGEKEHYVHFSSASGAGYNNIVVQPLRHGHLNVHLGFLQIHHRYHVEFTVPWNVCLVHPEGNPKGPAVMVGEPNPNCRVFDFSLDRDDLRMKVELAVHKERFLKEPFQITCCDEGAPLTIYLNARVFGKDQGTPILRNGIRSIAIEEEDDEAEDESDDADAASADINKPD